ncbi:MAG: LD-carboxypeptidase [Clostridiales bacterium]|nr:LD-carboxypeptidase [Clostridiales bacterium]
MKYPAPLKPRDQVVLVAPSSPVPEKNLQAAVESIEYMGLVPMVMPSCRMRHGYMAGPDSQRAQDINTAFVREDIRGIFCLRGGYGTTRILPLIDFDMIANNPKVFVGYSDVTALHTAITQRCDFVTYHGPMPNTDYRELDQFTLDSLKKCLFSPEKLEKLENPADETMKILHSGNTHGILTGGNISLIMSTLGSPYEIDTKGKILFLEDVGERPYRLDKSLTAIALAGKFRDCSGIILGTFAECEEPAPETVPPNTVIAKDYLSLEQIIEEVILPWRKPTLFNLRAGHIYPQSTLPLGSEISLNLDSIPMISISKMI